MNKRHAHIQHANTYTKTGNDHLTPILDLLVILVTNLKALFEIMFVSNLFAQCAACVEQAS